MKEVQVRLQIDAESFELDPKNPWSYVARGELYRDSGNIQRALEDYELASELAPKNSNVRESHANLLRQLGRHREAIAEFTATIELDPDRHSAVIRRGNCYRELGQFDRALAEINHARELHSGSWPWLARGQVYAAMGELEQAIADFSQGLVSETWNRPAWLCQRADSYWRLGEIGRAIDDYTSAIEAIPTAQFPKANDQYFTAFNRRGDCYVQLEEFEKAAADFARALEHKFDGSVISKLNNAAKALGDEGNSAEPLTKLIAIHPENAELLVARGNVFTELGEDKKALIDFDRAIELIPNHAAAHRKRAECHQTLGKMEAAIADYQASSRLGANDHIALFQNLIECFRQLGATGRAAAEVNQLFDLDLTNAEHFHKRGDYLSLLGESELAIDEFSRALKLNPDHAWSRLNRGHCHAKLGDREQAHEDYLAARNLRLDDPHFQFVSGERLLELEKFEDALLSLDRAIELAPNRTHYCKRRAVARFHVQDFAGALADLRTRVESAPEDTSTVVWIPLQQVASCPDESFKAGLLELAGQQIESTGEKAQVHFRRARLHLAFEKNDLADTDLQAAVELEPNNAELWNQIGLLYGRQGQEDKAHQHYTKTIELDSSLWYGWFNRALSDVKLGRNGEALADFSKAAEINPKHARIWNQRGLLYHRIGDIRRAYDDYSRCIELEPNVAVHWANRAVAQRGLGNLDESIKDADKALELNPNQENALQARAQSKKDLKDWSEAIADFTRLLELKPNKPGRYLNRGKSYQGLGQTEQAQADFDAYLKFYDDRVQRQPNNWKAINLRGVALTKLEQWEQARQDFTRAIELAPRQAVLRTNRATTSIEQQQWSEAADDLKGAIALGDTGWRTRYHLALCQLGAGNVDGYRITCQDMIESVTESESPLEYNFAAWTCCLAPDALEDWKDALELARRAVAADSQSLQFQNTLGTLLLRSGQKDEAVQVLLRLNEQINPSDPPANVSPAYTWYALALAYEQSGDATNAQPWLEKANQWTSEVLADSDDPLAWNRRLTLQLLGEEAKALPKDAAQSPEKIHELNSL